MSPKKLALVVLGMHRSGTSAMTRVLGLSGFTLPRDLMPPQPDNPSGFWESRTLSRVNDDILDRLGSNWDDVFAGDDEALGADDRESLEDAAMVALEAEFQNAAKIVIKDPRVCLLAGFWKRVLARSGYTANFVLTVRDPLEVAGSLAARDGFVRDKSLLLWLQYMLSAEQKTRQDPRAFVAFEDLIARPDTVLERLDASLPDALSPRSPADIVAIDRFVTASLRHHTGAGSFAARPLDQSARSVFEALQAAARGSALDVAQLDDMTADLARHREMLGVVYADLARHAREVGRIYVDIQGRNGQAQTELAAAAQERDGLVARLDTLERDLAAAGKVKSDQLAAEEQLRTQGVELASAQAEIEALASAARASAETALQDRQAADAALSSVRADREALETRLEVLRAQVDAEASSHAMALQAQLDSLAFSHAQALEAEKRRAHVAEKSAATAEQQLQGLNIELRTLNEVRREAVTAIEHRAEEVRVLLERATSLAESLGRARSEVLSLVSQLAEKDAAIERVAAERDIARAHEIEARSRIDETARRLDEHDARLAYLQSRWWWRLSARVKHASGEAPVGKATAPGGRP